MSLFLLEATAQQHLEERNSTTAKKRDNIYVDNVITGIENTNKAIEFYKELKEMFKDASMNVQEFLTSLQEINDQIKDETE